MRKYWLCILLLWVAASSFAKGATYKLDSLRTVLRKAVENKIGQTDTATINNLNKLAYEYLSPNPDSTLYYGKIAIESSRKVGYRKGIADGLLATSTTYSDRANYMLVKKNLNESVTLYSQLNDLTGLSNCYWVYGTMYTQIGKSQEALTYLNKALAIKLQIHDWVGTSKTYRWIGNVYDNIGHSSTALDYYYKSLSIDTKYHNKKNIPADLNNIGFILQHMEIYPEALEYFHKALNTWKHMRSYGGIAVAYINIAEVLMAQHKYDEAITYSYEALKINKEQDDKDGISNGYSDLGICFLYKKQNEKALSYLQKALKIATESQLGYNKAVALANIALYYNENHDFKKAYSFALNAKSLSNSLGATSIRTNAYIQLIEALGGLQQYKQAYFAQKELDRIRSSFTKDEGMQKFTSYNFEYNYAVKQRQQMLQQRANNLLYQQKIHNQRLINIIFGIIISAMVVILCVYYRQRRKQIGVNRKLSERNHQVLQQKVDLDQQAQELNDLNRLKDRLISILAHDLRSPLSTLKGAFSLLDDESITHEELLEMIPSVLKKLEYTSDFVDTLLFWINSQMDNFGRSVKSFSIKDVVDELSNYKEQASSKGIVLIESIPDGLTALSDPNSIRIVIRNLITNAIKFSGPGDTIEVVASEQDNHIMMMIKDTGTGMTEQQCKKLFMNKVESQIGTQNELGTGMGLLFCKELIENCNGKIWVQSKEGVGTTFYFTIPTYVISKEIID